MLSCMAFPLYIEIAIKILKCLKILNICFKANLISQKLHKIT